MSEFSEIRQDIKQLLATVARIEARLEYVDKLDKRVTNLYRAFYGLIVSVFGGSLYLVGQYLIKHL